MRDSRTRTVAVLLATLLVCAAIAVPAAARSTDSQTREGETVQTYAFSDDDSTTANGSTAGDDSSGSDASAAPGAMLSGVVGTQQAEFEGAIERAAFGLRVANAASQNATASIVGDQLAETQSRLETLRAEKQTLLRAHENGSIDDARFRAEMAAVVTETQTVQHLANQTGDAAAGLPAAVLRAQGINATAIQTLQTRAAGLNGPQVVAIAQSIAGLQTDAASTSIADFVDVGEYDEITDANDETVGADNETVGVEAGVDTVTNVTVS